MKTEAQIKEEISHQESEYDRHKKIADAHKNDDSELGRLKYQNHSEVMGRHASRRQALMWVIS